MFSSPTRPSPPFPFFRISRTTICCCCRGTRYACNRVSWNAPLHLQEIPEIRKYPSPNDTDREEVIREGKFLSSPAHHYPDTMTGDELLKQTADEVSCLLSPAQVIGTPLEIGDKVVIPLVHYGFGFGAGSGQGREKGEGGSGAGGGGGISPVALVIVHKDIQGPEGIQVMSLRKQSALAQVISNLTESLAPQVIDAVKEMAGRKKEE
jgi:uncharacterized spore protein YtfJ